MDASIHDGDVKKVCIHVKPVHGHSRPFKKSKIFPRTLINICYIFNY